MKKELKCFSEEVAEAILELKHSFEDTLCTSNRKILNFYTFECNTPRFQDILSKWIGDYDKTSITVEVNCLKNVNDDTAFNVVSTSFLYQGTYVEPRFENRCTTIDSDMPTILGILRECVSQSTANPVMKID